MPSLSIYLTEKRYQKLLEICKKEKKAPKDKIGEFVDSLWFDAIGRIDTCDEDTFNSVLDRDN